MRGENIPFQSIEPWVMIMALTLTGIAIVALIYCFLWFYCNRKKDIVVSHQPALLLVVCVGLFLRLVSAIPLSIPGSSSACLTLEWFYNIGHVITFAGLYSKLWRMNKIFHSPQYRRISVKLINAIVPLTGILVIMILQLLALSIFDPPRWTEKSWNDTEDLTFVYGYCESKGDVGWALYTSMGITRVLLVVAAIYQAYLARNISSNFSETWPLALTLLNYIQLGLIYYPVRWLIFGVIPSATYLLDVFIVLLDSTWILLAIFLPLYLHSRISQESRTTIGSNVRISRGDRDPIVVVSGTHSNTARDDTDNLDEKDTDLSTTKEQSTASLFASNSSTENVDIDDQRSKTVYMDTYQCP